MRTVCAPIWLASARFPLDGLPQRSEATCQPIEVLLLVGALRDSSFSRNKVVTLLKVKTTALLLRGSRLVFEDTDICMRIRQACMRLPVPRAGVLA